MDLIVVADSHERSQLLLKAASKAGYRIVKLIGPDDEASVQAKVGNVDAAVVICDAVAESQLRAMQAIVQVAPMPVLVLTNDGGEGSIQAAVKAGASSYVAGYSDLAGLDSMLRVAAAYFQQHKTLCHEMETIRTALVQRKIIEKAKGIIMKQRNIDEDNAYKEIRKLAMNHNKKIGEVAGQIVTAAEVLL